MLTYSFEQAGDKPLYEYLYECIRDDILSGRLQAGEKLPSKRALARNLGVSTITIEGAYGQLTAEGYCQSAPRRGFFVSNVVPRAKAEPQVLPEKQTVDRSAEKKQWLADFTANSVPAKLFPFDLWTRLLRKVISEDADSLLARSESFGVMPLRQAIADHLRSFRGLSVQPEQIVIGAGTEYLYHLLVQFFGRDRRFCVENPGYDRIRKVYMASGADCVLANMDEQGVRPEDLTRQQAQILHISPSHHFPTGIIMPVSRRYELLGWAAAAPDRYIIEDDYDSEFRLTGRPIPTMMGIDVSDRVIYINTFSKSLTPTIRISYMVLPKELVAPFREKLGFYSCTVSNFEQYTLARFIQDGYFEKHINRMRNFYRRKRERLLALLKGPAAAGKLTIIEHGSGLHFLLRLALSESDAAFGAKLAAQGLRLRPLAAYYEGSPEHCQHLFVLNYSGVTDDVLEDAVQRLLQCVK
ncbi:GntR family transcriptional regulator / MocR family aminotransferase [Selenomonas sp. GACV-9]|nr:GntR family transcriptional regulator / MocR family aminotransferase [Selenomonas ruminantium]